MSYYSSTTIAKSLLPLAKSQDKKEIEAVVEELIKELKQKKRLRQLPQIMELLKNYMDEEAKIKRAKITTGTKLEKEEEQKIIDFLEKKYYSSYNIVLETLLDEKQPGITIEVGDDWYDLTIKNQLVKLTRMLNT